MKVQNLGIGLNSVAAEASVKMMTSPFAEGREVAYVINCDGFNGTVKIQSSDDDTVWADVVTVTEAVSDRSHMEQVELSRYMRANVTAYTAGNVDVQLLGNV